MKVILLQSHEKLGNVGEIVNVKPGFARNYLIPNRIASLATTQNIKALEVFLRSQENKEAKNRVNLEVLSKKLNSLTMKFDVQVGEDDKLFGSVTSQMIADELSNQGYTIDKKEIQLDETIKELGNYKVEINLGYDLDTKVKVKVLAAK
jgi:large subunit ribosomal protein L9|tara:strand:+ start:298 stop:744 length:447 start_codon:yes stop_codon:yes gene_type:complete